MSVALPENVLAAMHAPVPTIADMRDMTVFEARTSSAARISSTFYILQELLQMWSCRSFHLLCCVGEESQKPGHSPFSRHRNASLYLVEASSTAAVLLLSLPQQVAL